ncbi:hypothetical protein [Zavarzinella formosa]|nr:hypothetical protein [Zavarzinella formosa]
MENNNILSGTERLLRTPNPLAADMPRVATLIREYQERNVKSPEPRQ